MRTSRCGVSSISATSANTSPPWIYSRAPVPRPRRCEFAVSATSAIFRPSSRPGPVRRWRVPLALVARDQRHGRCAACRSHQRAAKHALWKELERRGRRAIYQTARRAVGRSRRGERGRAGYERLTHADQLQAQSQRPAHRHAERRVSGELFAARTYVRQRAAGRTRR